jgi:hypothetical protein
MEKQESPRGIVHEIFRMHGITMKNTLPPVRGKSENSVHLVIDYTFARSNEGCDRETRAVGDGNGDVESRTMEKLVLNSNGGNAILTLSDEKRRRGGKAKFKSVSCCEGISPPFVKVNKHHIL